MKTLKALSALLTYPTRDLVAAVPEIRAVLADEGELFETQLKPLAPLLDRLARADLYDLQEGYVFLFDRTRALSLHLFEHVHGEGRDRGQAMVDLKGVYEAGGLEMDAADLPDFIPMFLEYCSLLPPAEAKALLSEPAHVLSAIGERLRKKESDYAPVFEVLVALAHERPTPQAFEALLPADEVDPDDLKALDAVWEEEEVRFGPGAAQDCGVESLTAKLRQARRPAPGLEAAVRAHRTVFTHTSRP